MIFEFDGELNFIRGMGGLARHLGSAYRDSEAGIGSGPDCFADLMSHWLNVAGRTGMPCDPRLWTEAPISGTFPACVAVEAALDSPAPMEAFERHLEEVRELPEEARDQGKTSVTEGHERLSFPSAILTGADGVRHGVYGFRPFEAYRDAALAAGATQVNSRPTPRPRGRRPLRAPGDP